MIHNDAKINPNSNIFQENNGERGQILEIRATKNKISAFGGWWFFKYNHTTNNFVQLNEKQLVNQYTNLIIEGQNNGNNPNITMRSKTMQ